MLLAFFYTLIGNFVVPELHYVFEIFSLIEKFQTEKDVQISHRQSSPFGSFGALDHYRFFPSFGDNMFHLIPTKVQYYFLRILL